MHQLLGAMGGFHAQYQVNGTLPHSKEMGLLCTLRGGILFQERDLEQKGTIWRTQGVS